MTEPEVARTSILQPIIRDGTYRVDFWPQGQASVYLPEGQVHGLWTPSGDSQSEDVGKVLHIDSVFTLGDLLKDILSTKYPDWPLLNECPPNERIRPSDVQSWDECLMSEDEIVLGWTHERLASEILGSGAEADMPRLREMILAAENTSFAPEESARLARWLLDFALCYRNSDDPTDAITVLSAIRTGASMLHPDNAVQLRALLDPGHPIETSLVALKMVGRLFEAQPPTDVDQHPQLASDVREVADSLLNRHVITNSQNSAKAHLALYALAAMASTEVTEIAKNVRHLQVAWFTRQADRDLRRLRQLWLKQMTPIAEKPRSLLNSVIRLVSES